MRADFPIYCGEEAIARLIQYNKSRQLDRFLLICDENTRAALGRKVEAALQDCGWNVQTVVLAGPEVIADEEAIVQVLFEASAEDRMYLAVGSGTITDVTRFCSHRTRNPFISLPTAPSVDGYTSIGAPLVIRRVKTTAITHPPVAVFADLQTLCEAPPDMVAAGFGDLLGKYTSLADWQLGALLWDEPYDPAIARRIQRTLESCASSAAEVGRASAVGITRLMEGLLESGLCMLDFGETRPASGSEHHISHFWEMKLLQEHRPAILHGAKVGVSTVLAARRYETVRGLTQEDIADRLATASLPDWDDEIASIRAAYGAPAGQVIASYRSFRQALEASFDTLKQRIKSRWGEVQGIAAGVPPAQEIIDLLEQVGGPTEPWALGLSEDEKQQALEFSHYLRNRFTVSVLGRVLGIW
jgi:glycerol-1-phosphate dehydrogenase [NAD(P)+]